ncbi:DUF7940 domain-containing protein [Paraburkholderia caballeronis]|uniref:DUF7940 domain-containing protein n=1 Tax=Paraburkholderia caballeronis TaxID=416943 RepID=UPI001431541E|nr:hypothetical protein [Paraburkholderia caballeronis]
MIASTALSAAGGAWSALPDAWIDRLPLWVVLAVPCVISLLGIVGAYLRQPEFD